MIKKDFQYYKFCAYGFLKNMRFFDPFILLFFREVGFSFMQIGFLFSIREISNTLLEIPSGIAADFFGRKNSMLFSYIAYISSFVIFSVSHNYYVFIVAMFLFACGESFRSGTHKAMIVDYLKIHEMIQFKTEYYGSTRAWSQIGSAISSLIAGALVIITGKYQIIFAASIIPYLVGFVNMLTYPEELNGEPRKSKKETKYSFQQLFSKKEYRAGLLNSAIYDGMFKSVKDYLQPILKSFALGLPLLMLRNETERSSIIIAIVYFILFFLSAAASKNSYRVKQIYQSSSKAINTTFLIGILITIIAGITYSMRIEIVSILMFVMIYILQNLRRPINTDYITQHIPGNLMATGLSIETQIKTVTIAILSPILGFLADSFGVGNGIVIVSVGLIVLFPFIRLK